MLREIFSKIASEMGAFLLQKGNTSRVIMGMNRRENEKSVVYIEMQDYGMDPLMKNRVPSVEDEPGTFPNYAHLLSFFVAPGSPDYDKQLQLLETVVEFFEMRPFFQLSIDSRDYELAISMKSVTTLEFNQFWIARQERPQPVLFYQARVSAI